MKTRPTQAHSNMTSTTSWFTSEIQQMMFGFGDSRRPQHETAVLVEEIVHQQMVALVYKAWDVTMARGDKNISIEDVLFLLRKDKTKLKRLLKYYEVRDMKNILKSNMNPGDDGKKVDVNLFQLNDKSVADRRTMGKTLQLCYDFLSSIDQTGELVSLFNDKEVDVVKHERMVRAELQSQGLDAQAYVEFCKARQTNFSQRHTKSQRFRDWLMVNINPEIVLTPSASEIFSYLAYETVAQIVDLALLVKQDRRAEPGNPVSRYRHPLCVTYAQIHAGSLLGKSDTPANMNTLPNMSPPSGVGSTPTPPTPVTQASGNKKKAKRSGLPTSMDYSWDTTLMPSDVQETMRRYYSDISPLASLMKFNPNNSPWNISLCC